VASTPTRQMALTLFMLPFGYHAGVWQHPDSRPWEVGQLSLIKEMAQAAERAKLHACFFADSLDVSSLKFGSQRASGRYDPIVAMSALIGFTDKIGLIGTASTTFNEPYNLARHYAEIDILSGGRAGWNIVTSVAGGENFGMADMPEAEDRYERATEFVDVVRKLWLSWDADAIIVDRERGLWVEPDRLHQIDHVGKYYSVRGPFSFPRTPQGHPVLVQAGQSPAGMRLGSAVGDVIYTGQPDHAKAIEFYATYKDMVKAGGRDPEGVKIIPGIMPIVAETEAEALEIAEDYGSYVDPINGRKQVEWFLDVDTTGIDYDEPIPAERLGDPEQSKTPWGRTLGRIAPGRTIRELAVESSRAGGHQWMAGSASQIADRMIEWFDSRACDGFNLNCPQVPVGMNRVLDLLVPELQERGYFQTEYRGDTLRERMGLNPVG